MLDAGHYGKYNQGVNKNYYESEAMWKLHLLLKAELEKYGFEVGTTRADQKKDLGVIDRGKKAKGYDLFLSLHSNAVNDEKTDRAVIIYPINNQGKDIATKLAKTVSDTMSVGYQLYQRADNNKDYYGVIRGAVGVGTVGIIIEHSFHTNKKSCDWLLNEYNLGQLAKAEAYTIAEHYGMLPKPTPTPAPVPTPTPTTPFPDVKGGWYAEAVNALKDKGVINGYPDGTFKPEDKCSRAEVAQMVYEVVKLLDKYK